MKSSGDTPIACSLVTADFRDREAKLLRRFRSAVLDVEELPDGYSFRLPGDGKWIMLVAELMAAERECCPFVTFEMAAMPNHGAVIVRVSGPEGAKEFVKTVLWKNGR